MALTRGPDGPVRDRPQVNHRHYLLDILAYLCLRARIIRIRLLEYLLRTKHPVHKWASSAYVCHAAVVKSQIGRELQGLVNRTIRDVNVHLLDVPTTHINESHVDVSAKLFAGGGEALSPTHTGPSGLFFCTSVDPNVACDAADSLRSKKAGISGLSSW